MVMPVDVVEIELQHLACGLRGQAQNQTADDNRKERAHQRSRQSPPGWRRRGACGGGDFAPEAFVFGRRVIADDFRLDFGGGIRWYVREGHLDRLFNESGWRHTDEDAHRHCLSAATGCTPTDRQQPQGKLTDELERV